MKKLLIITQRVDADDQLLGFFIVWMKRFSERFERVTVICQSVGVYELPTNVTVLDLGKQRGASKAVQLLRFYRLLWTHRAEYDVVFVHMNPIWAAVGAPWLRLLQKRVFLWYTHKAVTVRLRVAALFVHGIFTASRESFRLTSRKVVVTGHGIDTNVFIPKNQPREERSFLVVGRIAPVKNLEVLVDAVGALRQDGTTISIDVIGGTVLPGDLAYRNDLLARIRSLGCEEQFHFLGTFAHASLISVYQSHAVFVHLSKTGSLDKTILEAMACGMNVVSCNDAARAFLPSELLFDADNAGSLKDALLRARASAASPGLREYVVSHHNLDSLIATLARNMTR